MTAKTEKPLFSPRDGCPECGSHTGGFAYEGIEWRLCEAHKKAWVHKQAAALDTHPAFMTNILRKLRGFEIVPN